MKKRPLPEIWDKICTLPILRDEETRVFTIALLVSLTFHAVFLVTLTYRNIKYSKKLQKNIEVIYQALEKKQKKESRTQDYQAVKEPKMMPSPRVLTEKDANRAMFSPSLSKSAARMETTKTDFSKVEMSSKQPLKMSGTEGKRHVSVPLLDSEKITNPKYLSYHDRIRNKIKNRAYMYVDNPAFANGEVYLTFVVAANGEVTAVKVIEEKTRANDYLRGVGLRSIKECSPFPAFPSDLKYPELTFNVVISFETGE